MEKDKKPKITEEKIQAHLEVSGAITSFLKQFNWTSEKPIADGYYWVKTTPSDERFQGNLAYVFLSSSSGEYQTPKEAAAEPIESKILCLTFINKASMGFHSTYKQMKKKFDEIEFAGPLISPESIFNE